MKRLIILIAFITIFYFFIYMNNKECFNNKGRKIYVGHSGGKNCKHISTNINNKGFACCTAFNEEQKYGNKCCVKVDKQHNCQQWDGFY